MIKKQLKKLIDTIATIQDEEGFGFSVFVVFTVIIFIMVGLMVIVASLITVPEIVLAIWGFILISLFINWSARKWGRGIR